MHVNTEEIKGGSSLGYFASLPDHHFWCLHTVATGMMGNQIIYER